MLNNFCKSNFLIGGKMSIVQVFDLWWPLVTSGDLEGQFFVAYVTPRGHSFPTVYGTWVYVVYVERKMWPNRHTNAHTLTFIVLDQFEMKK